MKGNGTQMEVPISKDCFSGSWVKDSMKAKINCNAGCCEILESVWNQWMRGICTSYFRNIQGSDLQTTINQVRWFEESFKHVCRLHTNKQQAALSECLSISNFFRAFEVFFTFSEGPHKNNWAANDALLRQEKKPPRRSFPEQNGPACYDINITHARG